MFKQKEIGGARNAVALLARVLTAVIFVASGGTKILMYNEQVGMFVDWGVPFAEILVPLVGLTELAAGVAVLVGFLGRLAASALAGVMVGAFLTAGPNGLNVLSFLLCFFILTNGVGGWHVLTEKEAGGMLKPD
ncbi:DoxX family protein [Haladaptatus sp. F3-133]|jgi:uncharacterized membrane protein YphA (DoxX/SURF4 family)|uniref:DoxX family protein n=1 Tax=Halorutilus salinus TaxID=2487751 RepID=A0A9Q4C3Y2_9EURY|nr:DoxX family protein [Halorutilus salinus]MCX2819417.1 DoxX family protein [Halorutilus salinus]